MKKIIFIFSCMIGSISLSKGQATTAMAFTMTDCNSTFHSLYADYLDNEEVVIIEYFMTCASCATAGQKLDPMYVGLTSEFPGKVNFFVIAYNNTYSCSTVNSWRNTNTPNAIALDSGAAQVSYYGGMGMPTVVVLCGSSHQVIYNSQYDDLVGQNGDDTAAIHAAITNCLAPNTGTENLNNNIKISVYPNPSVNILNLEISVINPAQTSIEMVDMMGKIVRVISNSELSDGLHQFQVETSDLSNGMYFIRINSSGRTVQRKVSIKH